MKQLLSVLTAVALLASPAPTLGQVGVGATVSGVLTDPSKALLPGATITATDAGTGRQYVAASDDRGEYRILNITPGTYDLQAELSGFATVKIANVELLVGQNATIPFRLQLATVQETVTVTGETPLVDTRSAAVAGNVDRRQMAEIPLAGRNWMELAMLVKGITTNNVDKMPGVDRVQGDFQLNVDGQQITMTCCTSVVFGQPKFSREAVAEFQISTSMFDVTQGRSSGIQVQAITRSGTNTVSMSAYGYFRDDALNAADPVAKTVLPYQNQQVGGTIGGPLKRDKLLYFVSYEYEREPRTAFLKPPQLPNQSFTIPHTNKQHFLMARADHNLSEKDHLTYRLTHFHVREPWARGGAAAHPSVFVNQSQKSSNALVSWSRVLSNTKVQEIKLGYGYYTWEFARQPEQVRVPAIAFPGLTLTGNNGPQWGGDPLHLSLRYDLTWHKGRHDLKIGGEGLYWRSYGYDEGFRWGTYEFSANLTTAEFERRFPASAWNNPAAWDISGLDPLVQQFSLQAGNFSYDTRHPTWAVWIGDTWKVTNRLTLNYGIRWDDDLGMAGRPRDYLIKMSFAPFGDGPLYRHGYDHDNVAPRAGFSYSVTDRQDLVIRGGTGLFFGEPLGNLSIIGQIQQKLKNNVFLNDRQPGFIQNPTRNFTEEQIQTGNLIPQNASQIAYGYEAPVSWQSGIGFQKQLGTAAAVEADLTYSRDTESRSRDVNLFFDPATGYNLDPNRFGRPDPRWARVTWLESSGSQDDLRLAAAVSRRYKNNVQATVSYTLMFFRHDDTSGNYTYIGDNSFDMDAEWARATDFQRHTVRANGIVNLPWGVTLAGVYQFGSGNYFSTSVSGRPYNKTGANRLNIGAPIAIPPDVRGRFDGPEVIGTQQTVPRNALRGFPIHKVDVRLTKTIRIRGNLQLQLMAEMFNLFNHANFGAYNGAVNTATFGQPLQVLGNAYRPRTGQLAFRVSF